MVVSGGDVSPTAETPSLQFRTQSAGLWASLSRMTYVVPAAATR
jgi:hypothetical protein